MTDPKPMTVGELITYLTALDSSMPVYNAGCGGSWTDALTQDSLSVGLASEARIYRIETKQYIKPGDPEDCNVLQIWGPHP